MINSVYSTSLQSMQRASSGIAREARNISSGFNGNPPKDIVNSAVSMIQDKHQFVASAKLIKVADDMTGHLLDIIA